MRSHPQGFAQCRNFLNSHRQWQTEAYNDTASAVASIARSGALNVAAIAGEAAARAHGLKILRSGIETNPRNYTRFVIISRRNGDFAAAPSSLGDKQPNKASLVFSVQDRPGSLFDCLKVISERGINLSKLESRPIQGQPWQYLFYVDVSIPKNILVFNEAIESLKAQAADFHLLGVYRESAYRTLKSEEGFDEIEGA